MHAYRLLRIYAADEKPALGNAHAVVVDTEQLLLRLVTLKKRTTKASLSTSPKVNQGVAPGGQDESPHSCG